MRWRCDGGWGWGDREKVIRIKIKREKKRPNGAKSLTEQVVFQMSVECCQWICLPDCSSRAFQSSGAELEKDLKPNQTIVCSSRAFQSSGAKSWKKFWNQTKPKCVHSLGGGVGWLLSWTLMKLAYLSDHPDNAWPHCYIYISDVSKRSFVTQGKTLRWLQANLHAYCSIYISMLIISAYCSSLIQVIVHNLLQRRRWRRLWNIPCQCQGQVISS